MAIIMIASLILFTEDVKVSWYNIQHQLDRGRADEYILIIKNEYTQYRYTFRYSQCLGYS